MRVTKYVVKIFEKHCRESSYRFLLKADLFDDVGAFKEELGVDDDEVAVVVAVAADDDDWRCLKRE